MCEERVFGWVTDQSKTCKVPGGRLFVEDECPESECNGEEA